MIKRKKYDNIIFGRQPVIELFDTDKTIDKIYLSSTAHGDIIPAIKRKAAENDVPLQYVPVEKLNGLTGGNHQGVIAFTTEIDFLRIDQLLPHIIESGETPLLLILDGITDVRNFGAIARTAYCTGVNGIVIPVQNSAPVNSDAVKTSAGALQKIPICREKNYELVLKYLKLNGIQLLGTDAKAGKMIAEIDFTLPTAILMGSEDEGLSPISRKLLSETAKIPMINQFDSYNVSVAAGMILYESMTQRIKEKK